MSMTLASLTDEIAFNLQYHPRYTQAVLNRAANKGIEELTKFTRQLEMVWQQNALTDVNGNYIIEYDLTPIFPLEVNAVTFDSSPLRALSREEYLLSQITFGNQVISDPTRYFIKYTNTAQTQPPAQPASPPTAILCLFPRPGRTALINVWLNPSPVDLVNPTDVPFTISSANRDSVVLFGTYYCLRSWKDEQDRADYFWKLYLQQRVIDKETMRLDKVIKTIRVN